MKKVVLVETKNIMAKLVSDTSHFKIFSFSSLDEALKTIEHSKPDLLILSEEFGDEVLNFCKQIRAKHSLLLPILLVTNFYSSINISQIKNLGVQILIKPFGVEELISSIENLLGIGKHPATEQTASAVTFIETVKTESEETVLEFEKIKPFIKQQVRVEVVEILKFLLEGIERKYA